MGQANQDELTELRERLRELEETIEAIRSGDVDALVVEGSQGTQVFTLKGAEEPYRMLVEHMQEGALTLTNDGTIVYSNRAFSNFISRPLEQIVGKSLAMFVADEQQSTFSALLSTARRGGARREMSFESGLSERRPAIVSLSLLSTENVEAFSAVITDLQEQRRSAELAAAERFARSILEQAMDAIVVCDTTGKIMHMSRAAEQLARKPGRALFKDAFEVVEEQGPRNGNTQEVWIEHALSGQSVQGIEVRLAGSNESHFLFSAGPLYDSRNVCIGCIVTLTDISERKQAELRQRLLIDELNHRVKNTLAAVQSIAVQTHRTTNSASDFRQAFTSRLLALARAHDLVTLEAWQGAALADVARQTLSPFTGGDESRVSIGGPHIKLSPNAAVTMSMGFHELATNAAKYGALSSPNGCIALNWEIDTSPKDPAVKISWIERGGPKVKMPTRRGFGSRLLQQGLVLELDGAVDLDYAESGLICVARLKLSDKIMVR